MNLNHDNTHTHLQEDEQTTPVQSGLFLDDQGTLPLDTRRVLIQLLTGPTLDAARHSKLWPVLIKDEKQIRSRLSELFLDLVLDRDLQVAFTRQADTGELEVPTLLRRAQLTFIDSVLLLYLRQGLTRAETQGMRAVVAVDEIIENLLPYERKESTDHAGFIKRIYASIEKLKKHNILQKIRASDDRFEISPTLRLLFSTEEIQALTQLYRNISSSDSGFIDNIEEVQT
jgi:hypothetical protein